MSGNRVVSRQVRSDVRATMRETLSGIALVMLIALLACFFLHQRIVVTGVDGSTVVDYLASVVGGDRAFVIDPMERWQLPILWMLFFAMVFYVSLGYPLRDLEGMGAVVITLSGSRWQWWLSKCVWVVMVTLACVCCAIAVTAGYGLATGASFSTSLTVEACSLLSGLAQRFVSEGPLVVGALASLACVCCAWSLLQLFLGVALGVLPSYIVTLSMLAASALSSHWLLPGNYLMLFRYSEIAYGEATVVVGVCGSLVLGVLAVVGGGVALSHSDLLPRGRIS